jgi:hypothetical protein
MLGKQEATDFAASLVYGGRNGHRGQYTRGLMIILMFSEGRRA